MTLLTKEQLKTLTQKEQEGPFVSIFMPTHPVSLETKKDAIRLKNLLSQAEEQLLAKGVRTPRVNELLEPAKALLDDNNFWQHQRSGLAIFLAPDLFRTYALPLEFTELLVVADRFHLKPLMPLLSDDGQFYVLALSQNEVRLFQGTRHSISQVEVDDIPKSLAEALRYDDPQKQQQFHTATATPGSPAGRPAVFHGHGVGDDNENANILRYFQQINKGLRAFFQDDHAPLVLAGVEYLLPIYKEANTYPYLVEEGVTGNPETMKPHELHRQAWAIVEPIFKQSRREAASLYKELANTERASKDIRKIVPAAHYGRVDKLFVAVNQQQWGAFDPDTNTIDLHREAEAGDEDLLDMAATQTLLNGGTVYAVEPEKVPDDSPMAAVFRY